MFIPTRQQLTQARLPTTGLRAAIALVLFIALVLTTTMSSPAPSWAIALQDTQFQEKPATLIGPRADSAIALYIRPAPNQQPVGYGMSGDRVTVTDQFGDYLMEDDPSATWSHIRLEKPPYTEGWLRGQFLSIEESADTLSPK